MPSEPQKTATISNTSQRILAAGVVVGFCYWASSVVMTLLVSILLAYFLDPFVEFLGRRRVPRAVGSLVVVMVVLSLLFGLAWGVWDRAEQFVEDWPKYREPIRNIATTIEKRFQKLEEGVQQVSPTEKVKAPAVRVAEESPVRSLLLRGFGALWNALISITFIPFLVFFMLAAKTDVWHATMQLFPPGERTRVKNMLDDVGHMLRGYIIGNALVAVILGFASWIFFLFIGLEYPFLTGIVSGVLNLVPYMGVVLAWMPPIMIALVNPKFHAAWQFAGLAGVLGMFHLLAINWLIPALVGKSVHLNALSVTVALLFWGFLWGGMGFLLAIPMTAAFKVFCDHVEEWQPIGRWLGT